jgi:glycosyltransferase involved in cell wall biosynthesis
MPSNPHVVDVKQLVAAQLTLLNNEAMANQLGMAGRQRVQDFFSRERMVQSTIATYRDAIRSKKE